MAYGILSEDFLAICLLFAEGDLFTPMVEVIRRIEAYQDEKRSYFGESEKDVRRLFCTIGKGIEGDSWKWGTLFTHGDDLFEVLGESVLQDFIMPVLGFHNVYFNDEGEWWEKDEQRGPTSMNQRMRLFFLRHENPTSAQVIDFLSSHEYDWEFVRSCMVGGSYDRFGDWAYHSPVVQRFIREVVEPLEKKHRNK